jgi:hypothetical protein
MTLILVCLLGLQTPTDSTNTLPAWIASLHRYEQEHGRDSWSWRELMIARASVASSRWSIRHDLAWWIPYYSWYVKYHLLPLGALTILGGICFAYTFATGRRKLCTVCALVWWIIIMAGMVILTPNRSPTAIIKPAQLILRTGNGITYSPTIYDGKPVELYAGVEARYRGERPNGWVQVELKNNILGWVPKDAVYLLNVPD